MLRSLAASRCHRAAALLLLLPGCLVSFNDYPLEASPGGNDASNAGGASAGQAPSSGAPSTLIDDFEDGDQNIPEHAGRSGAWYAANDGQGMQTPPASAALIPSLLSPARGASQRAAHTFGGPFGRWGALIGTSLASDEGYDLGAYDGVRFWVRSESMSPGAARQVRFMLPTAQTNVGGGCTVCNDHFGAAVPLSPQWSLIELRFADLAQEGYGVPRLPAPDLSRVLSIQFLFPPDVTFDLWVDDVALF